MSSDIGHVLSTKSRDLQRDTFIFISLSARSELFFVAGINQKLTPASSATIHHWVEILRGESKPEPFWLCPVTVHSAGIMAYYVRPSGPAIEPYSKEPLPAGNYGWYFDRECTARGFPDLTTVPARLYTLEARLNSVSDETGIKLVPDVIPAAEADVAVARDEGRCRFTGCLTDTILVWIIPPAVAWETEDSTLAPRDTTAPFLVAANIITMQRQLRFHFHNNHFTVDVDDDYRILVLRAMGDAQSLLPSHLPRHVKQSAAADHFLRLHCRHSLSVMLLGGDIAEVYSNSMIIQAMSELGVDYAGSDEPEESEMVALEDVRWQSELGQEILAHVMKNRMARSLYESERSVCGSDDDEAPAESAKSVKQIEIDSEDWPTFVEPSKTWQAIDFDPALYSSSSDDVELSKFPRVRIPADWRPPPGAEVALISPKAFLAD
ncbi:hypothetical protein B0H15DRAFT_578208 [Mycena belliarum]|uniref:Uncharacterized protein n=1 Tax=Mycena belliarum TaxID=1033014 RepID=A0AAD6XG52_9AGAR|nr:hypothetical protein B0H15DRAFT_578208 [Mycena belliae]